MHEVGRVMSGEQWFSSGLHSSAYPISGEESCFTEHGKCRMRGVIPAERSQPCYVKSGKGQLISVDVTPSPQITVAYLGLVSVEVLPS
jgi:hypothetical protein